jgi:phosphohistidine swiveling domain-containing protein
MSKDNGRVQTAPGKPIPTPEDFPVRWENPDEGRLQWVLDGVHYPNPMTPLEFDLTVAIYEDGRTRGMAEYDVPVRFKARRINSYFYRALIPVGTPPDGVMRLMNQVKRFAPGVIKVIENKAASSVTEKYFDNVQSKVYDLDTYWDETLLPEIKRYLAEWEAFDLRNATTSELTAHLDNTVAWAERIGTIHYLVFIPYVFAMSQFDELYRDLFDGDGSASADAFAAYRLLQGFDNMILAGDRMLWELGRKALTMPAVQKVLEEKAAANVIPALKESAAGQVFLEELNAFLKAHGQRGSMFSAISEVSWIEDPTPVIKNLKDYVTQPDRDMGAELAAEAAEREQLVNQARARLNGYPQPVVDEFERLLKAAQTAVVLHSDHGYWIDYRAMYEVRRVVQEFGRRLAVAGAIDAPQDVFLLTLAELKLTAQNAEQLRRQAVVAERKAEMEHFGSVRAPATLGTMALMTLPDHEPMMRAVTKTEGAYGGATLGMENGVLQGSAGSPGTTSGPARVVRSLAEAEKLRPGDILVAETTAPPWTPLFATAAAVVTDTGGILSHCAVVAREYHIPAVVGTGNATQTLRDGQMIEVDGDAGLVRLV